MSNGTSPVGRIVDAARRIVEAVSPGGEAGREDDKRGPIPATAPPGLKQAGDTAKRIAATTAETARGAASRTVATAKGAAGTTADTARRVAGRTDQGTAYEEWTKADLYERAQELDIPGRSTMNKSELIEALRDHG